jgi:hypothetical protein
MWPEIAQRAPEHLTEQPALFSIYAGITGQYYFVKINTSEENDMICIIIAASHALKVRVHRSFIPYNAGNPSVSPKQNRGLRNSVML